MALEQVLITNPSAGTASITFNNPGQVDQVSFGSGVITFGTCSSYNLSQSDLILYFQFLAAFNNSLFLNFPSVFSSVNQSWPVSLFEITTTVVGVEHLTYAQTSLGISVLSINYVPVASAGSIAARGSPVTITLQEFFMCIYMLQQYSNQVLAI